MSWWEDLSTNQILKGKTHPHFTLPDWLNHAIMAENYFDEYASSLGSQKHALEITEALKDLREAFGEFDIWTMTVGSISLIQPQSKLSEVPQNAAKFLIDRAS